MIYSPDINRICALCKMSERITGTTEHLHCTRSGDIMPPDGSCGFFDYDIFKKPTHRKRRLKNKFRSDDFKL